MKKHQLSVSLDATLVEMLQTRAADMHLSLSAVLNYTLWHAMQQPSAPTAATPAATPAAAPTAAPTAALDAATPAALDAATPAATPAALDAATPAALDAATPAALDAATPAALDAATPTATPTAAPYDEAWKKWKAVPEPKDGAEALALCKAAGMDMNYITETNAQLAWTLYMETGKM